MTLSTKTICASAIAITLLFSTTACTSDKPRNTDDPAKLLALANELCQDAAEEAWSFRRDRVSVPPITGTSPPIWRYFELMVPFCRGEESNPIITAATARATELHPRISGNSQSGEAPVEAQDDATVAAYQQSLNDLALLMSAVDARAADRKLPARRASLTDDAGDPLMNASISKEQAAVPHSLGSKELAEWRTGRVRSLCVALRGILADYIERMEDPHQCVQLPMQAVYALALCAPDTKRKAISAARNVLFESEHLNLVRMPVDEVGTDVDAYVVKYDAKGPCPYRAQLVTDAKAFYALIAAE